MKRLLKRLIQNIFANRYLIFYGNGNKKQIALTFDDGPNASYTDKVLRILKENNIKATFFLLGEEIESNPELTAKITLEGHELANHTFDHSLFKLEDINRTFELLGRRNCFFRPPRGKLTLKLIYWALKYKFSIVLWSIDSCDWRKIDSNTIINNENLRKVESGDIILFHDDNSYTIDALGQIVVRLKKQGYAFKTVSEILI